MKTMRTHVKNWIVSRGAGGSGRLPAQCPDGGPAARDKDVPWIRPHAIDRRDRPCWLTGRFKLGYALDLLAGVRWLETRDITYWGDIDTHGFAMLDKLRANFPAARSMLMDLDTFLAHRRSWSREEAQHTGELTRLTASEQCMLDDLRNNRHGDRLRLEQERVSLGRARQAADGRA
jgi:hypothetical protein